MSAPTRHQWPLAGGNVSYLRFGEGTPRLHFAHATGFNAETYRPLLAPLAGQLSMLAGDARGHGFTSLPTGPGLARGWTVYASDLARFLAETAPEPVILAGHSMGASISAMVAAAHPGRVAALLLIEPVLVPRIVRFLRWFPIRPPGLDLAARAGRRRDRFPSAQAALASYRGRGAFRTWGDDFLAAYLAGGLVPEGGEVRLACAPAWEAQTFRSTPYGLSAIGARIACPVTLLYAEHSTPPQAECRAFARRHGRTRLLKIPGTTHFLPMERPDIVREEIARLLVAA